MNKNILVPIAVAVIVMVAFFGTIYQRNEILQDPNAGRFRLGAGTPTPSIANSCGVVPITTPPLGSYSYEVTRSYIAKKDGITTHGVVEVTATLNGKTHPHRAFMNPVEAAAYESDATYRSDLIAHLGACAQIRHAQVEPVISKEDVTPPTIKENNIANQLNNLLNPLPPVLPPPLPPPAPGIVVPPPPDPNATTTP